VSLREIRFQKRINQWDLALQTGMSQSKISLFERGYLNPKEDEKKEIAKVLDCNVTDLFPEHKAATN